MMFVLQTKKGQEVLYEVPAVAKRDPNKNYFLVPNEVFHIGLSHPEISIYCYLLSIEDRETYQCWPSYKTIGKALGMCQNTVSKYVRSLEEKGLIRTEPTMIRSKDGRPLNGNLLYTICPIQAAVESFYERQLRQVEEDTARRRAAERLAESAAEAPRTPYVRLWGSLRSWIPPRAWRADLGRFRGRFQSRLLNHFRGWRKKRGRRKKQDKTLAPQAPPGRSRLPAVRAVSGSVGWRL